MGIMDTSYKTAPQDGKISTGINGKSNDDKTTKSVRASTARTMMLINGNTNKSAHTQKNAHTNHHEHQLVVAIAMMRAKRVKDDNWHKHFL